MSLALDLKYANLLAPKFERFTRKGNYLFNVRCPLCGDSKTSKTKMRGYIYRSKKDVNRLTYRCHNCQRSVSLALLIKFFSPEMHNEYRLERLAEAGRPVSVKSRPKTFDGPTTSIRFGKLDPKLYENAEMVSKLPEGHYALAYVQGRLIPKEFWGKLYYTENYQRFIQEIAPKCDKALRKEPRLVIPYYDAYGAVIAVTGRALKNSNEALRYVTVRLDDGASKLIYGLDRVDQNKLVYIVEGPFDSLFLPNAVASGDSNLIHVAKQLSAANVVLVFDNEKRSGENVRQMEQAIREGYRVCIWPAHLQEKDINALVLAGRTPAEVKSIIDNNIFSGLTALTHLTFWKKTTPTKGRFQHE